MSDETLREAARVEFIKAVAGLDGYQNPNTARGDYWDKRCIPVMAIFDAHAALAAEPAGLDVERKTVDACIYIVEQSRDTAMYEKDYPSVIAREHVIRLLSGYRDGLSRLTREEGT